MLPQFVRFCNDTMARLLLILSLLNVYMLFELVIRQLGQASSVITVMSLAMQDKFETHMGYEVALVMPPVDIVCFVRATGSADSVLQQGTCL
jgi:hypothetical protein